MCHRPWQRLCKRIASADAGRGTARGEDASGDDVALEVSGGLVCRSLAGRRVTVHQPPAGRGGLVIASARCEDAMYLQCDSAARLHCSRGCESRVWEP